MEHGDFVAEHDDFNSQFVTFTPAQLQQLEASDEGNVKKREVHVSVSWARAASPKSCSGHPGDPFGTHTL
jgi:hypothetical protein